MKRYNVYGDYDDSSEQSAGSIAKERLKRTIRSERMKVSDDVMDMMQSDLRALIEKYLGTTIEESDLILEVSKPDFVTPIMKKDGFTN